MNHPAPMLCGSRSSRCPGRRNLMVTVPGLSDEPRPSTSATWIPSPWELGRRHSPLGAIVRDDKLCRGACDMKGGLACAIAALVHTLERVAADGALPRRGFSLICSVDEEDLCAAPRRPSTPAGSARANGYWTPSPPMDRFRLRTRDAHGSRLR
ncbi:MAG: hypothetical protein ACLU0O_03515 [Collinsella sp.]